MNNCPIFISSADSYSDIWPIFFDLFKIYWPEYSGKIYLNTEEKTFSTEGLNIICTQVGYNKTFGITFRKGLDQIKSENILLMMIDYIFMGKVNNKKIFEYFNFFVEKKLDSLCLTNQQYPNTKETDHKELFMVTSPAPYIMFSYQIAFWKKSMLYQMALPHEDPWTSEWYGTLRAEKMHIKLAAVINEKYNPIPYHLAGCLHKGKWLSEAIEHLKSINYNVDFDKRGYYHELPNTIKSRIIIKWKIVKVGLLGSYSDLIKRKNIYDN
ncbi:MAG: hypothetical protein P4L34_01060 [Paludibacter sp.]|nr:hypothetical protein [Paludibacter sp.]